MYDNLITLKKVTKKTKLGFGSAIADSDPGTLAIKYETFMTPG
jgi:hypothetical protein